MLLPNTLAVLTKLWDGCTNITLTCTMKNRKPTITFVTTNKCPKSLSEELFNATAASLSKHFDSIRDILAVIMNNTGIMVRILYFSVQYILIRS